MNNLSGHVLSQPSPRSRRHLRRTQWYGRGEDTAYQHIEKSRPDWNEVKIQAMAWVQTLKVASSLTSGSDKTMLQSALDATGQKKIVEISYRDQFWGAKPVVTRDRREMFSGSNVLDKILTQTRDGARKPYVPHSTIIFENDYSKTSFATVIQNEATRTYINEFTTPKAAETPDRIPNSQLSLGELMPRRHQANER